MKKYFVGVDPGDNSAFAIVDDSGDGVIHAERVDTKKGIHLPVKSLNSLFANLDGKLFYAAVEGQWTGHNRNTAISLARNAGIWECALCVVGSYSVVWRPKPNEWRKYFGLANAKSDDAKKAALEIARLKLGWETDDDNTAEACLIAEACRLYHAAMSNLVALD